MVGPHLPTEHELTAAAKAGSPDAFVALVEPLHPRLLRYLTAHTGDPELAADLAQESLLDAFEHLAAFDGQRSFPAWLFGIAKNNLHLAHRRRPGGAPASLDRLSESASAANPALHVADASGAAGDRDAIRRILHDVSPDLRDSLLLHALAGLTIFEVAQVLDVSPAAAQKRISRARLEARTRVAVRRELVTGDRYVRLPAA